MVFYTPFRPFQTGGFTLIELLVVVLVIGILAAVALPQYEMAVRKTRLMRLLPLMTNIDTAQRVYRLANGEYSPDFESLDIEMPAGAASSSPTYVSYKEFSCVFQGGNGPSVYCYDNRYSWPRLEKYYEGTTFLCWTGNDDKATALCKAISKRSAPDGVSGSSLGAHYSF